MCVPAKIPLFVLRFVLPHGRVYINPAFPAKQQLFLGFVLSQYLTVEVEELDQPKLTPLLRLKYNNSIADAVPDLGKPDEIGKVFAGFQKYLYSDGARFNEGRGIPQGNC